MPRLRKKAGELLQIEGEKRDITINAMHYPQVDVELGKSTVKDAIGPTGEI